MHQLYLHQPYDPFLFVHLINSTTVGYNFLEIEKNQGNIVARILTRITETPSKFIAAMLVGNNISLVVYGIFMGDRIISLLYPEANGANLSISILFYQTLISTVIILLTAEFLPKVFFQLYANKLIKLFIIPAATFYYLFYPITL